MILCKLQDNCWLHKREGTSHCIVLSDYIFDNYINGIVMSRLSLINTKTTVIIAMTLFCVAEADALGLRVYHISSIDSISPHQIKGSIHVAYFVGHIFKELSDWSRCW